MPWLSAAVSTNGNFSWAVLDFWMVLGWTGNVVFGSRFFVQWWATERQKRVVVPTAFWWLSLLGSLLLLIYSIHRGDLVFVFANLFNWIPYTRSLIIGHRMKRAQRRCIGCQTFSPGSACYCAHCGLKFDLLEAAPGA